MVDFEALRRMGTTNERLREIFTAALPSQEKRQSMDPEAIRKIEADIKHAKAIRDKISSVTDDHIQLSLKNYAFWGAVDLAWDSTPINKATVPLMMYAQGRLDMASCIKCLTDSECNSGQYIRRKEDGTPINVVTPKFADANINLIRSVITRRLAAQSNRFANLYPLYKYEPRGTSMTAKLRGEVMSQIVEIHADWWDYRGFDVQVMRHVLMYAQCVVFPVSSYEKHKSLVVDENHVYIEGAKDRGLKEIVTKEGVNFVNPHPTRVFWDTAYPLSSVNTDSGCNYIGYWDVMRWGDIKNNVDFWNRDDIGVTTGMVNLFANHSNYFTQYYTKISAPRAVSGGSTIEGDNDRLNNVGTYSGCTDDSAVIVTTFFYKITPLDYGIGSYPYPVWVRFVVAGDNQVIYAEIMPSAPAAYCGYNVNDSRLVNISMAHELMSFQDHLTNLQNLLLVAIKGDTQKVLLLNTDVLNDKQRAQVRKQSEGQQLENNTLVVEYSGAAAEELKLNYESIIKLIQTAPSSAINVIFQTIAQLVQMAERLVALSPQEQGQPAPREISATETNMIAGTTESVYGFIGDSIDAYRAAKKRIIFDSIRALGTQNFTVPVTSRFTAETVQKAGLKVAEEDADQTDDKASRRTVIGTIGNLGHDFIFTTRDGAERAANTQAANVLNQLLLGLVGNPVTAQALGKERLFMIMNEIARLGGSGIDLKLEMNDQEDPALGVSQNDQVAQLGEQLTAIVEQHSAEIAELKQLIGAPPQPAAQQVA